MALQWICAGGEMKARRAEAFGGGEKIQDRPLARVARIRVWSEVAPEGEGVDPTKT